MGKTENMTTEEMADVILEGIPNITNDFKDIICNVLNEIFKTTKDYYQKNKIKEDKKWIV
jgi:hypothetical protein